VTARRAPCRRDPEEMKNPATAIVAGFFVRLDRSGARTVTRRLRSIRPRRPAFVAVGLPLRSDTEPLPESPPRSHIGPEWFPGARGRAAEDRRRPADSRAFPDARLRAGTGGGGGPRE